MNPQLDFSVTSVYAERRAPSPTIRFRMCVRAVGDPLAALVVRYRVQIEPAHRGYAGGEQALIQELFGETEHANNGIRPLQWSDGAVALEAFADEAEFEVRVPCTYDMDVASAKYVNALRDGEIPVRLIFGGTAFRRTQTEVVAETLAERQCATTVPLQTWHDALDAHFHRQAWIRVGRTTFDELCRYRAQHGLLDWESTLRELLGVKI
jgi:hypothetical protein